MYRAWIVGSPRSELFGGTEGVLGTVAYYRTPFVFVYRQDSGLSVSSLDDEVLSGLNIGTYLASIPHISLVERGLSANVDTLPARPTPGGPDRNLPLIEAVESGELDLAILYGPAAAYHAQSLGDTLKTDRKSPTTGLSQKQLDERS